MTDFRSATPHDVWPQGCPHPPAVQQEIFRVAKDEVTWGDVQQSRFNFVPWYTRFFLAEQRVLASPPKQRQHESEVEQLRRRVEELETRLEYHTGRINRTLDRISNEYIDGELLLDILAEHLGRNLDVDVLHDGERNICFRVKQGDQYKHYPIHLPVPLDRGTFQQGQSYTRGDCVTFGGQVWLAQCDTFERPGGNEFWRLAVRRGKDARAGT